MKRFILMLLCLDCLLFAFAQNNDEETGIRYFKKEQYSVALPYLQRAAKAGSVIALDCLGQMYGKGLGVQKNKTIMRNMYNKAIQANYAPSMYNLAFDCGNNQEMLKLLKKAASLNFAPAYIAIGDFYKAGLGGNGKFEEAKQAYSDAIKLGLYAAYGNLGSLYKQLGDNKKAYEMFVTAMKHDKLTNSSLSDFVELLCDKSALCYSNDYEENLAEAGRILDAFQNTYPDKVGELKARYGASIKRGEEVVNLFKSCVTPKLGEKESAANILEIPALQKRTIEVTKYQFLGSKFTISFCMKATDVNPQNGFLFYAYSFYTGNIDNPEFPQACIQNNQFNFKLGTDTSTAKPFEQFKDVQASLLDGKWHHIILVYDNTQKKKTIYIDGVFKGNEYVPDNRNLYHTQLVFCAGNGGLQIRNLRYFMEKSLTDSWKNIIYEKDK